MTPEKNDVNTPNPQDIGDLVESVSDLGERARLLGVNLAVVAAKLKKQGHRTTRLNEEILDLVSRITRASQDVSDSVRAMKHGRKEQEPSTSGAMGAWTDAGVPDEKTLDRLTRSLNETLELSRHVFRWIRDQHRDVRGTLPAPDADRSMLTDDLTGGAPR